MGMWEGTFIRSLCVYNINNQRTLITIKICYKTNLLITDCLHKNGAQIPVVFLITFASIQIK